jgi:hypothetical protein
VDLSTPALSPRWEILALSCGFQVLFEKIKLICPGQICPCTQILSKGAESTVGTISSLIKGH